MEDIVNVDVEDIGILLDIDTKDGYERLRSFGQSGRPPGNQERCQARKVRCRLTS
jgi:hypothetical protein